MTALSKARKTKDTCSYPNNEAPEWGAYTFDGYYSAPYAWADMDVCMGCGEEKVCLHADSSDDEYGAVRLCSECIAGIFESKEG